MALYETAVFKGTEPIRIILQICNYTSLQQAPMNGKNSVLLANTWKKSSPPALFNSYP